MTWLWFVYSKQGTDTQGPSAEAEAAQVEVSLYSKQGTDTQGPSA